MNVIPNNYRIYRRQASGYFYLVDETQGKPKHTRLKTKDSSTMQAQRASSSTSSSVSASLARSAGATGMFFTIFPPPES